MKNRKQALYMLGASDEDIDALLAYTENVFLHDSSHKGDSSFLLLEWLSVWEYVLTLCKIKPVYEIFESAAGTIPVIFTYSEQDFERLVREIAYKGREMPGINNMGASFVFGKALRFIILSNKPYSGIPAAEMELEEANWLEKSMIIRKHHECAHHYTKQFLGSSRNNLHDELIADFFGLYAAFGEYRAEWFIKFFNVRFNIYTKDLSASAAEIIKQLAVVAAKGVEQLSKTEEFQCLNEGGRIEMLAKKELLSYVIVR